MISGQFGTLLGHVPFGTYILPEIKPYEPIRFYGLVEYKAQEYVFSDLSKRLGLADEDTNSFVEAMRIVNLFTYSGPLVADKKEKECLAHPCREETSNPGEKECCELVAKARMSKDVIKEIMELTVPHVNAADAETQSSMLPRCSWSEAGECWSRVTTDMGVCFTNFMKGDTSTPTPTDEETLDSMGFSLAGQSPIGTFSFAKMLKHLGSTDNSFYFDPYDRSEVDHGQIYEFMITSNGQLSTPKTGRKKSVVSTAPYDPANGFDNFVTNVVSISPTLLVRGTEEFKDMDVSQRKCYYSHEKKLEHFEEYTQANCYLECAWDKAEAKCSCVPWFLAKWFPNSDICQQRGNTCFKDVVDNRFHARDETCQKKCPNDCETLEFEVTLTSNPMKHLPECSSGEKKLNFFSSSIFRKVKCIPSLLLIL